MRHKDPELMKKIHDFAEDYFYSEGHSPSTTEVAVFAGISRSTSYNYLVAMDKIGMIEYDGKTIRTEKMRKTSSDNSGVELYDKTVPCGELEEIDASVSEYVNLGSQFCHYSRVPSCVPASAVLYAPDDGRKP